MFLVLRAAARAENCGMWLGAKCSRQRVASGEQKRRLEQRNTCFCTDFLGLLVPDRCLHLSYVRFF